MHEVVLHPLMQDGNIQNGCKSWKTLSGMQDYKIFHGNLVWVEIIRPKSHTIQHRHVFRVMLNREKPGKGEQWSRGRFFISTPKTHFFHVYYFVFIKHCQVRYVESSDWIESVYSFLIKQQWSYETFVGDVMEKCVFSCFSRKGRRYVRDAWANSQATSWENLLSVVCAQVRPKLACSATEESQESCNFGYSTIGNMLLV